MDASKLPSSQQLSPVDVAIIGGGIGGLGVAEAIVRNGRRCVLFERGRCGEGASANSLRIIHGGMRYLQALNLRRAAQSLVDQLRLLNDFPDFVTPLPCLMPLERFGLRSAASVRLAGALFRVLAHARGLKALPASVVNATYVNQSSKLLCNNAPYGAFLWNDAVLSEPAKLIASLQSFVEGRGGGIVEGARIERVARQREGFLLEFTHSEGREAIESRTVVNCAGAWMNAFRKEIGVTLAAVPAGWCLGFNVLLDTLLELHFAVGLRTAERRLFFVVPRGDYSVVGTGYIPYVGEPDGAVVAERDVVRFLENFNQAARGLRLSLANVRGIECGLLPMKENRSSGPLLYGSEEIYDYQGYVEVLSTKYTTFRSQAEKVWRTLRRYLRAVS